jgi:phage portal protein BeeE
MAFNPDYVTVKRKYYTLELDNGKSVHGWNLQTLRNTVRARGHTVVKESTETKRIRTQLKNVINCKDTEIN